MDMQDRLLALFPKATDAQLHELAYAIKWDVRPAGKIICSVRVEWARGTARSLMQD
jgi:hypothetical protein